MSKKQLNTPRSRVRAALRSVWMKSRERAAALKRTGNTCEICGKKQSMAKGKEVKLEVHHTTGIGNWNEVIDAVYKHILCHPDQLQPLCKECHERVHEHD